MNAIQSSPVVSTVDYMADGVQHGHLRLPYSRDDSAWGSVMIPLCVIRNGEGPTALLVGGNHGDEYEGPVALFDLARTLDYTAIRGRVIILPALNYPAFQVGRRTSPIDGGILNRAFPGRPDGTVTEKIADYVARYLAPMADLVLDFHSGGRTLDFLPYAAAHALPDKAQEADSFAAVAAFGAPWSMRMVEIDAVGMFDTLVEGMGKPFITTELGGGGTSTARSTAIAKKGVRNLLRHAGILREAVAPSSSRWLAMPADACFIFVEEDGLAEFHKDIGDEVRCGDVIASIHGTGRTGQAPRPYPARMDGLLAARHFPGLAKSGDCLAVLAVETGSPLEKTR